MPIRFSLAEKYYRLDTYVAKQRTYTKAIVARLRNSMLDAMGQRLRKTI